MKDLKDMELVELQIPWDISTWSATQIGFLVSANLRGIHQVQTYLLEYLLWHVIYSTLTLTCILNWHKWFFRGYLQISGLLQIIHRPDEFLPNTSIFPPSMAPSTHPWSDTSKSFQTPRKQPWMKDVSIIRNGDFPLLVFSFQRWVSKKKHTTLDNFQASVKKLFNCTHFKVRTSCYKKNSFIVILFCKDSLLVMCQEIFKKHRNTLPVPLKSAQNIAIYIYI